MAPASRIQDGPGAFHNLQTQTFGQNIRLFRIIVGQPMPQAATM